MIVYPICSGLFIPWVLGKLGAREALKIENRRNLILIWKLKLRGPNFKMTSMEKSYVEEPLKNTTLSLGPGSHTNSIYVWVMLRWAMTIVNAEIWQLDLSFAEPWSL
jgi:hypothetical protein